MPMAFTLILGLSTKDIPLAHSAGTAQLTSPVCNLQVTCGQVLFHILLEGFLKELLPLLQLQLLRVLHFQNLLRVFCIKFSCGSRVVG